MPTDSLIRLPKTKSAEEFESMCVDILKEMGYKNAEKYGRNGQSQDGIDIISLDKECVVAQCKNSYTMTRNKFISKVSSDLKSASEQKKITFHTMLIMTALDRDKTIQNEINVSLQAEYDFKIKCIFWDDIERAILQSLSLLKEYYPTFISQDKCSHLETYRPIHISNAVRNVSQYFLQTTPYNNALKKLNDVNIIILEGRSGIGKTETAFMIANYLLKENGYSFSYVRNPNIVDFKNILQQIATNSTEKEVIIFDDFFGSGNVSNDEDWLYEMEDFLENIDKSNQKKYIFTSRKTILQQIKVKHLKIGSLLKSCSESIDLDNCLTPDDKIEILFSYFRQYKILENIKSLITKKIWTDRTFADIIDHKNFTPMIVKMATIECVKIDPAGYENTFLNNLEHPLAIWEKEINSLDRDTRHYINVLFSLSDGAVDIDIINLCYDSFRNKTNSSSEISIYDIHKNIETLTRSGDGILEFIHPSLLEYLKDKLSLTDKDQILDSAVYLEQVERVDSTRDRIYIRNLMKIDSTSTIPSIFKFKVLPILIRTGETNPTFFPNLIQVQYLKYLYEFRIEDKKHELIVIEVLKDILLHGPSCFFIHANYVIDVFSLAYDFSEILSCEENVKMLFSYANATNIWYLINLVVPKDKNGYDLGVTEEFITDNLKTVLIEAGEEELASWILDNIDEYIDEECENIDDHDVDALVQAVLDRVYDDFDTCQAKTSMLNVLEKHLVYNFNIDDIAEDIFQSEYIYDLIEDAVCK